jgi:hypothetical protein
VRLRATSNVGGQALSRRHRSPPCSGRGVVSGLLLEIAFLLGLGSVLTLAAHRLNLFGGKFASLTELSGHDGDEQK